MIPINNIKPQKICKNNIVYASSILSLITLITYKLSDVVCRYIKNL